MYKIPIFLRLIVVALVVILIAGCSNGDKSINPAELLNQQEAQDSTSRGGMQSSSLSVLGADKWPLSLWDFKFPFRGAYNACTEQWSIACGYGCYLHVNTYYPHAGTYSVDLVRDGGGSGGSCVLNCARGVVSFSGWMTGYGWCVVIDHDYGHTGKKYKSIVAHLATDPRQYVNVGNDLLQGTFLGYCGHTGGDYIDHIHFSVWQDGKTVPLTGISGYTDIKLYGHYVTTNVPVQPPANSCTCR